MIRCGCTSCQLASCKSASRLLHVLARSEAEAAGADEALMLNEQGQVVEASSANFFWIHGSHVYTPPLDTGALDGVTRRTVLELCTSLHIKASEKKQGRSTKDAERIAAATVNKQKGKKKR